MGVIPSWGMRLARPGKNPLEQAGYTRTKTVYAKSTDKSRTDHELQRTYEITMTIGPDGKLTTEEKPVENNKY